MGRHEAKTTPIHQVAPTDPIPKSAIDAPAAPTVQIAPPVPAPPRAAPRAVGRSAPTPATAPSKDHLRWALGAVFAVIVVAVGVVLGLNLGGDSDEPAAGAESSSATSASPPPPTEGPPAPAPPPPLPAANGLADSFAAFAAEQLAPSTVGLVIAPVGGEAITLAPWAGPETAWSTIKVPLSIAGLRSDGGGALQSDVESALTVSDNAAAERIWAALGSGQTAADAVQVVLQDAGDPTRVQPNRIRPEFTPFGQTNWPLAEQVRFLSHAACSSDPSTKSVLETMGRVASDRWGLGQFEGAQFKGGWGPSESGSYLVRQFGVITDANGGMTVIAMAVLPSGGSFGEGQTDMNTVAQWLTEHRAELPAATCGGPQQ